MFSHVDILISFRIYFWTVKQNLSSYLFALCLFNRDYETNQIFRLPDCCFYGSLSKFNSRKKIVDLKWIFAKISKLRNFTEIIREKIYNKSYQIPI